MSELGRGNFGHGVLSCALVLFLLSNLLLLAIIAANALLSDRATP